MTATWILESNVFAEVCFDEMVAHFKAKEIPHHVVRIIPFIHEIEGKKPIAEGPVVVYGSIGVQKLSNREGWVPGVFGDPKAFSEAEAERKLSDLYLNWGQFKTTIKKLGGETAAFSRLLGGLGEPVEEFFIKPNTDTKEFAGMVIKVDEFDEWYGGMVESGYLDDNDFGVVISRPKKLGCEWRVVVVDGKISTASLYRQYQRVMPERGLIPEVEAVVMEAHALYQPAPVYVIDVAQVMNAEGEWLYKVIEYNTFNSAGLYACDVTKVIDDINALVSA